MKKLNFKHELFFTILLLVSHCKSFMIKHSCVIKNDSARKSLDFEKKNISRNDNVAALLSRSYCFLKYR
jgi:hypothetical protein